MRRHLLLSACICSITAAEGDATPEMRAMLEQFRLLNEITERIQEHHVTAVSRDELWRGAIQGMLANLDPGSRYLSPQQLRHAGAAQHLRTFGFDCAVDPAADRIAIVRVVPGSPAAIAGLVRGDSLLALGDLEVEQLSRGDLQRVLQNLGETCRLRVRHADGSSEELSLKAAERNDSGLSAAQLLDSSRGIGLVRLHRFVGRRDSGSQSRTGAAFRAAVKGLVEQGMRALILDLRGNPGGDLAAAAEVADAFLSAASGEGTLLIALHSRHPGHSQTFKATSRDTYPLWPLVVLIDEQTAAEAEACAAALREHDRAVLIGSRSAGRGSVQKLLKLSDGSAIELSVARYRTPSGRDLQHQGLQPDIAVSLSDRDYLRIARQQTATAATGPTSLMELDPGVGRAVDALIALLIGRRQYGLPAP